MGGVFFTLHVRLLPTHQKKKNKKSTPWNSSYLEAQIQHQELTPVSVYFHLIDKKVVG